MRRKALLVRILAVAPLILSAASVACAQQSASPLARAVGLMKNRQYNDAVKILREDMKGKPEEAVARQMLMLGECYYVLKAYDEARPLLLKASRNLTDDKEKIIAEYRLACTHFRLKDYAGAQEKIDTFVGKHPDDPHVGTLLVFRMIMLASQGAKAEDEIVALHKKIRQTRKQDPTTTMEADQILCDFYRRIGQDDKAQSVYVSLVNNFQRVIVDLRERKQPVPVAYEKSHDNAALQLGVIALERRQPGEAVKWLDNVRYDLDLKSRARLLLARIAYERKDITAAVNYLSEGGLIDMVPAGQVKSDMYLVLGLCEKAKPDGKASLVEECLKKVGPEAKGYLQAQSGLGDLYLEKGLTEFAVRAFNNCLASSDWAPHALGKLAEVALQQAGDEPAKATAYYKRASGYLAELLVKYPLSPDAKEARPKIDLLVSKGIDVSFAAGGDDLVAGWEKVAQQKKGSFEAAQALLSVMRHHFKTTLNEKKQRSA